MSLWRHVTRGLRVLTRRAAADADLDDEVQHYLDQATNAYIAGGLAPAEARRAARKEIGSATAVREQVRDSGWEHASGALLADVRFAGRMLRKSPVFTVVVVFVISLGSGAVTTIFSGMNAVVLRPLPGIADPSRLVALQPARRDGTVAEQGSVRAVRLPARARAHARRHRRVGQGVAHHRRRRAGHDRGRKHGERELLRRARRRSRRRPLLRRRRGSHAPVRVPSSSSLTRSGPSRLGGERSAVGRTVLVNGSPFTVIGVAPEAFRGIYTGLRVDAWVPLMMQPQLRPRSDLTTPRWLWLFGRLREGSDVDGAREELAVLTAAYAAESGRPVGPGAFTAIRVSGLTGLPNGEGRGLLGFMSLLLAAAGLVLLIAGVNVAALLSARYAARRREMAVRAALGAGRARLLRQLMTEVLALFLLGALGGFVLALLATAALEQLPLPGNVPGDVGAVARSSGAGLRGGRLPPHRARLRPRARAAGGAQATSRRGCAEDSAGSGVAAHPGEPCADRRSARAVARPARGRGAVHAGAGPRPADRSGIRHGGRGHDLARARVLGLQRGQGARRSIGRCANGCRRYQGSPPSPTPAACRS